MEIGRCHFGWEQLRTVREFDGRIKYGRCLRPGQDPGDAVFEEKVREDALRDGGLQVVRWIWAELESFDYCLGDYDVMAIYSAPDDTTATAVALSICAAGHLTSFKTTKLIPPAEFQAAARQAGAAPFQGPTRG